MLSPARSPTRSLTRYPGAGADAAALDALAAGWAAEGLRPVAVLPRLGLVALSGERAGVDALLARDEVLGAYPNRRWRLPPDAAAPAAQAPWHLDAVAAEAAWRAGLRGAGAVVAVLDTGVDGTHPALRGHYRGRLGVHHHHWLDVAEDGPAARAPVDPHGHGTAVAGLVLGADAAGPIGVAPDAEWIAVRAFDARGETTDLRLLRAAEWLLAPTDLDGGNPRPDLAPDVVNASWTLESGADPLYSEVLAAFERAGILAVFAAGNDEEGEGVAGGVRAPGSDPLALSVGALTPEGAAWWRSRRGPAWDGRLKPDLLAPGIAVETTATRGGRTSQSGTSMATPLVAGAAALLRGAADWLPPAELRGLLRAAARDGGAPGPDPVWGHGALDLGRAAALLRSAGRLEGRVLWAGRPRPATRVLALRSDGLQREGRSDADGRFLMALPAGAWTLRAEAPGLASPGEAVTIEAGRQTLLDLSLGAPGGRVEGRVLSADDGAGLAGARIRVLADAGAPAAARDAARGLSQDLPPEGASTLADEQGAYRLEVAPGPWLLRAEAAGHRAVTRSLQVAADGPTTLDLSLEPAPSLLIVDADAWQGERIAPYLSRALDAAGYASRSRAIHEPEGGLPDAEEMAGYDLVLWAHLFGSPGRLDLRRGDRATAELLRAYVAGGGRLAISGQDIGLWDSAEGLPSSRAAPELYRELLGARFLGDRSPSRSVLGLGLPGGPTASLADVWGRWKGGRLAPDVLAAAEGLPAPAEALLRYDDGDVAGLGLRGPDGRRVYLGFGPESAGGRAPLLAGVVGWLAPPRLALALRPETAGPGEDAELGARLRAGARASARLEIALPSDALAEPAAPLRREGDALVWEGELSAGEARDLRAVLRAAPGAWGGPRPFTATLVSEALRRSELLTWTLRAPDLRPSRLRVTPPRAGAGEEVALRLRLRNAGPAPADGAIARIDRLPLAFLPDRETLRADRGEVVWEDGPAGPVPVWRGTLAPGEAAELALDGRLGEAAGLLRFGAELAALGAGEARLRREASLRAGGPRLRALAAPAAPTELEAGRPFSLTWRLGNAGAANAPDARIELVLPADLEPDDPDDPGWRPDERRLVRTIGLDAGEEAELRFPLRTRASAGQGRPTIVARAEDGLAPAAPITEAVEIRVRAADPRLLGPSFAPAEPRSGELVTMSLRLVNDGDAAADLLLEESLPPSLVLQPDSLVASRGRTEARTGGARWELSLGAGEAAELSLRARVGSLPANARLENRVQLTSPAGSRVLTAGLQVNSLSLADSRLDALPVSALPGGRLRYRFLLRAEGRAPAARVHASVAWPEAASPVRLAGGLRPDGDGGARWEGELGPGQERALELDLDLGEDLAPGLDLPLLARAVAEGVPEIERVRRAELRGGAFARSRLRGWPAMSLPGELVRLRAVLRNAGPEDRALSLVLPLPEGLRYLEGSLRASSGDPTWDPELRRLTWRGDVPAGGESWVELHLRLAAERDVDHAPIARLRAEPDAELVLWTDLRRAGARVFLPSVAR